MQRVFAAGKFSMDNKSLQDFVLVLGETRWDSPPVSPNKSSSQECVCVGRELLLYRVGSAGSADKEICFVQYAEVIQPVHKVNETLRCGCFRWAIGKEHHYAMLLFGLDPMESGLKGGGVVRHRTIRVSYRGCTCSAR